MTPFPAKFCHLNANGDHVPHDYGNVFFSQPCGDSQRLVIGPSNGQVQIIEDLAAQFDSPPFYVLYVLLLSHSGNLPGRYQSPPIESLSVLHRFLNTFEHFIANDGRHHLWVASTDGANLLVYDQHNVIFAYGTVAKYQTVLESHGYANQDFWFPSPHSHSYPPENAESENLLLSYFPWQRSELQEGDEWD